MIGGDRGAAPSAVTPRGTRGTVLVVDDDRALVGRLLVAAGYRVLAARSLEALGVAHEMQPGVIVLGPTLVGRDTAEFALTQVLDRPATGRVLFKEVIRENLDLGRPDHVQLIFDRRVTTRTPGRFRTRVIIRGVTPSLYVDYKKARIKQYHKEGRALRTETTINDTRDFAIGKRLHNLPALRAVGLAANRRLLDVQRLSHDCLLGEDAVRQVTRPQVVEGQRVSALPFADPRTQALLSVLVLYCLLPQGFANKDIREHLAPLLGLDPGAMTPAA